MFPELPDVALGASKHHEAGVPSIRGGHSFPGVTNTVWLNLSVEPSNLVGCIAQRLVPDP